MLYTLPSLGHGRFGRVRRSAGGRELQPFLCLRSLTDIDSDGRPDAVGIEGAVDDPDGIGAHQSWLAYGAGDGTFAAPIVLGPPSSLTNVAIVVLDFNSDGRPDVAALEVLAGDLDHNGTADLLAVDPDDDQELHSAGAAAEGVTPDWTPGAWERPWSDSIAPIAASGGHGTADAAPACLIEGQTGGGDGALGRGVLVPFVPAERRGLCVCRGPRQSALLRGEARRQLDVRVQRRIEAPQRSRIRERRASWAISRR